IVKSVEEVLPCKMKVFDESLARTSVRREFTPPCPTCKISSSYYLSHFCPRNRNPPSFNDLQIWHGLCITPPCPAKTCRGRSYDEKRRFHSPGSLQRVRSAAHEV